MTAEGAGHVSPLLLSVGQVLRSLFGARLSSAILDPPSADDMTEALARRPLPPRRFGVSRGALRGSAGRSEGVPQFFLDFLQQQSKMSRRGRSSVVGGRGCFGMKIDRIGSISGLGC